MTDTTAPEAEAPESSFDTAADDAKYAAFEAKHSESEPESESQSSDPAPQPRAPLSQTELEERLGQTKAAMREERRKAREYRTQLETLQAERAARVDEDPFDAVIAALRDDDEDPLHDLATVKEVLRRFRDTQRAEREAERTQFAHQTAQQRHFSLVAEQEAEFREDTPDYDTAVTHFRESLRDELTAQGFTGDALNAEFAKSLVTLSQRALSAGKNPAEVVYALAQKRGYTPNTTQTAPRTPPTLDSASQKLQTLSRGQQASKSLSSVGNSPTTSDLTVANVAKLNGKDLLAGYAKLKDQAKRSGRYR